MIPYIRMDEVASWPAAVVPLRQRHGLSRYLRALLAENIQRAVKRRRAVLIVLLGVYTIQQTSSKLPANVQH